jgi:N-acetylmuramoyl-L-alanine amidase
METIFYLLRVSACVAGFYLIYVIIFRHIAAFKLNRAFLLAGLIVSFIIPSIDLSFVPPDYHLVAGSIFSTLSAEETSLYTAETIAQTKSNSISPLPVLYWLGVLACSIRLLFGVGRIIKLKARSKISASGTIKVFRSEIDQPFSFFNSIFLPNHEIDNAIIEHEKNHVLKYHWFDLLIAEVSSVLLWFNPIMIFYKRSLKMQHEYEADAEVLSRGTQIETYLDCMLRHLQLKNSGGLTSSFYSQNIKQRILMMTRSKASRSFNLLYLIFVPVVCGLLLAFSNAPLRTDEIVNAFTPDEANDLVLLIDPGHGGSDSGSSSQQANEKDIALSIAKSIQSAGEKRGLKVILTRTGDQGVSLEDRLAMVGNFKADMFLSIHLNYDPGNASNSGIDIMVSDGNQQFAKSSGIAEQLEKELSMLGTMKVNGIIKSSFYVLSRNSIPATLLELGYLSNKADHDYITDSKNQQAISERIVNAVVASMK